MQPTPLIANNTPAVQAHKEQASVPVATSPITTKAVDTISQAQAVPMNKVLILKKIEEYEALIKTSKTVAWVGLAIAITGVAAAVLFFTAPISVPLAVGAVAACIICIPLFMGNGKGGENPAALGAFLIIPAVGIVAALATGVHTFTLIKEGVYTAAAMSIAGIATGVLAGVGTIIGIAGVVSMNNYKAEILKLKGQLKQMAEEHEQQGDLDRALEIYNYLQDNQKAQQIEGRIKKEEADACFAKGELEKAGRYYQVVDRLDNIAQVAEAYKKAGITDGKKYLFALTPEDYQQGLAKINEARRQLAEEHLANGQFELAEAWYTRLNDQEGIKRVKAKARQVAIQGFKAAAEKEIAENPTLQDIAKNPESKDADREDVKRIARTYCGEHRLWEAYMLYHSVNDLEAKIDILMSFIWERRCDEAAELLLSLKDPIGLFVLQHAVSYSNDENLNEKIKENGLEITSDTMVSIGPMKVKATEAIAYLKGYWVNKHNNYPNTLKPFKEIVAAT